MPSRPPEEPPFVDSTAALASLYQAPLHEFIARRKSVSAQLKRSGHKEVAARIASAAKPSRSAYLVNQVYWTARDTYDAVLDAGTAARAAQQARLLGDAATDLQAVLGARDAAIRAAVAVAIASADGQSAGVSDMVAAQVRASFEALAAHGLEGRLAHGHLTVDVALPGLAAFAGLVLPAAQQTPEPVRRFEVVARRPPAEPSEPEVPPVDPRVLEAEAQVEVFSRRRGAAAERLDELLRTMASAREVATAAEQAAAEAAKSAAEARDAVHRAEASREAAAKELQRLETALSDALTHLEALRQPPSSPPSPPSVGPPRALRRARR